MHFGDKKSFKVKLVEAPDAQQIASSESAAPAIVEPTSQAKKFDKMGITVEPVSLVPRRARGWTSRIGRG